LTRPGASPLVRLDLLRGSFGPFLVAFLVFYTVQYIPTPLFPLHFVNNLNLTDGAISLGSALYYTAMLLFSLRVRKASDRYGHYRVLVFGALSYSVYPFLNWLARDARLFWVASIAGGGSWAITSAGLMNRLMEKVPEDDRPAHMALHNLALNLGILAGSLLGPAFVSWFDLRDAILISAGLRFLGGLLLWRWG
jgi:MFS family permease